MQIKASKQAILLENERAAEMAVLGAPLIVGQDTHGGLRRTISGNREINACTTTSAQADNACILELTKKLGIVAIAVLKQPANRGSFLTRQRPIHFDA